jgi:hypothetical protein
MISQHALNQIVGEYMEEIKSLSALKSNVNYYLELRKKYMLLMQEADDEYNQALDAYIQKYEEVVDAKHA